MRFSLAMGLLRGVQFTIRPKPMGRVTDARPVPAIDPYDSGMLAVGEGHRVYWECSAIPRADPRSISTEAPARAAPPAPAGNFDPDAYRIVLFDQRGSGRSRPLASEQDADLRGQHDRAPRRGHRSLAAAPRRGEMDRSGSLLGDHARPGLRPDSPRTSRRAGAGSREHDVPREWSGSPRDVGRIFPIEWERFVAAVPERLRHLPLVDAYATLLFDPDPSVRDHAAIEWCAWEDAHVSLTPGHRPNPRFEDPEFRLRFARLVTHYWRHAAFLEEEQLLRDAPLLNGIPGVLIHGRYDVSGPLETAWRLSRSWTSSRLQILDDAGHGGDESFPAALAGALSEFAAK